jgi:hypothetical protein
MPSTRSTIFIGSSSEGLPVAEALQVNLDHVADVVLWSQGVFGLSGGTLGSLVEAAKKFDFAVLVLIPDDVATTRGKEKQIPRDNVLFELGLFMGALGRERCFIIYDRKSKIQLPSDLAGVTAATFQPHASGELRPALGSASTEIKAAILKLGGRQAEGASNPLATTTDFRVMADLLEASVHQLFILMHEKGITLRHSTRPGIVERYEYALRGLKSFGHGGLYTDDICLKLADAGLLTLDLRRHVGLTDRGHAFAEWMTKAGFKAVYFWCDSGDWGKRPKELASQEHPRDSPKDFFEMQQRAMAQKAAKSKIPQEPQPPKKLLSPKKPHAPQKPQKLQEPQTPKPRRKPRNSTS